MVNGNVGFGKDEMCSYKHTHNGAVHTGFGVEKGIEFWLTRNAFPVSKVSLGLRNGFGKASRYTNRFSLSLKGQLGQTSFKIYTPINGMGISTHDFGIGLSRNILTPSGYATGFGFGQYLQQK